MRYHFFMFLFSFFIFSLSATPPLPAKRTIWISSPNKSYTAELNAARNTTTVYKITSSGAKKKLYQLQDWCRWASLSNTGYLAIPNPEASLLLNPKSNLIMLRIIAPDGNPVVSLKLSQLISNMKSLKQQVSHYYWGAYKGFNRQGNYIINTVEGNRFSINPKTGIILTTK